MIVSRQFLRGVACLSTVLSPVFLVNATCSLPRGLDFGPYSLLNEFEPCDSETCVDASAFDGLPAKTCVLEAIQAVGKTKPGLSGVETPVVNHWIAANIGQVYSAMAAFEEDALELWGRKSLSDARRRCSQGDIETAEFQKHRQVTLAYTVLWVYGSVHIWKDPVGGAEVPLRELASTWGIDFDLCDLDRSRAIDKVKSCNDPMTPWGLAIELKEEIHDWFTRDGWNRNGDLGGIVHNRIPYMDWRSKENAYAPVNSAFHLDDNTRWQPLLEHDDVGFLFHQAHVTPHIGETAKSIFLEDEEICMRSASLADPEYDLDLESDLVLERTRDLNETTKARVELFNDKLASLSPLAGQYLGKNGMPSDSFAAIVAQAANIQAIREATILVWRAKVEHDLIRPSSYIRNVDPQGTVYSYGGPDVGGPTDILRGQWQGYKRVMPHAEFPSGSSCVCLAYAEAMIESTDTDDFGSTTLFLNRPAGSSSVEDNMPTSDQVFAFHSWSDISEQCGASRLDGGMHFTAAVTGGRTLCNGVGTQVAKAFKALSKGVAPDYVIDYHNPGDVTEVRCPGDLISGSSTSSTSSTSAPICLGHHDKCDHDVNGCCGKMICAQKNNKHKRCLYPKEAEP